MRGKKSQRQAERSFVFKTGGFVFYARFVAIIIFGRESEGVHTKVG